MIYQNEHRSWQQKLATRVDNRRWQKIKQEGHDGPVSLTWLPWKLVQCEHLSVLKYAFHTVHHNPNSMDTFNRNIGQQVNVSKGQSWNLKREKWSKFMNLASKTDRQNKGLQTELKTPCTIIQILQIQWMNCRKMSVSQGCSGKY